MADKKLILCVDDDADILDQLKIVLEKNGYRFAGASSAKAAVEMYRKENPALIIVDLMMEEVDAGAQLVKKLKAMGNQAPVYMLSAVGEQLGQTVSPSELGLSGVFQKPLDFNSLLNTLKTRLP
jgi:DNA-binding response OmpR family regulator